MSVQAVEVRAGLGMNELETCPSPARLKTHRAHGFLCLVCEPDVEWSARCLACLDRQIVRGGVVDAHEVEGTGERCPGSGDRVDPPAPLVRQLLPSLDAARPWRSRVDDRVWLAIGAGS